jgi:hypothetical protein
MSHWPDVRWLRPNVVDGVIRWPPCEEREDEGKECLLAAKIDWRGKMLCRRHASTLALKEICSEPF